MRVVYWKQEDEKLLEKIAQEFGVDLEKLWTAYLQNLHANYWQDIVDIAKENEEELKGE